MKIFVLGLNLELVESYLDSNHTALEDITYSSIISP